MGTAGIGAVIDREIADKATFWGMFQIGGFNWRNCGCRSLDEFVSRMSASEAEQLELFARFCIETDLVKYLKKKDWNRFAYRYNGRTTKSAATTPACAKPTTSTPDSTPSLEKSRRQQKNAPLTKKNRRNIWQYIKFILLL